MRSSAIMAVQQIKLYKFSEIKSPLLREISVIPRPLKAERISLVANEKSFWSSNEKGREGIKAEGLRFLHVFL